MLTLRHPLTHTAMFALLLGTIAISLPALAADPASPPVPMTTDHTTVETSGKMRQHFDNRIEKLHDELKLTKEQEIQWDKVVQTMKDNHSVMSKMAKESYSKESTVNAVDHLKTKQAITQARAEGMTKFLAVFEPFYSSLSIEQKKTADGFYIRSSQNRHERDEHEPVHKSSK